MKKKALYQDWKKNESTRQKLEADSFILALKYAELDLVELFREDMVSYIKFLGIKEGSDFKKILSLLDMYLYHAVLIMTLY